MRERMIDEPMATVRRAGFDEIFALRHRVLRSGLAEETARFAGDERSSSIHVGAFAPDERCVGCATLHDHALDGENAFQLRGMAVEEDLRRRGVGAAILEEIERAARSAGVLLMWCNARRSTRGFYEKHGWRVVSDEFEIATAGPHFRMVKRMNA